MKTAGQLFQAFNGKFRDECLNEHWFSTLAEARAIVASWRRDYNENRPHSAIDYWTPAEYGALHRSCVRDAAQNQGSINLATRTLRSHNWQP